MNFAPVSASRHAAVAFMILGVVGSAYALWQRHHLLVQREAVLDTNRSALAPLRPAPEMPVDAKAPNQVLEISARLQRPWEQMLDALQKAVTTDVSVTRMQPETDAFHLRVSGDADSSQAFVDFVQRLRDDGFWQEVDPVSETRPDNVVPGLRPVSFQIELQRSLP